MTTWVSCYSDNGKPRFKRCNLQAKWLCNTLLYLLILDVRINIGDYPKWQYLGQHPWRWVLIGICLFEMVDEILFCMVSSSSIRRIERLNLDGFEKLLASVIQKELPVISVPKLTIAQRTAISIFSISLNNSRRSFLSNPVNPEILYINFAKLVQMTETTK